MYGRHLIHKIPSGIQKHSGVAHIADNLLAGYRLLIQHQWIGAQELGLVERWINDVEKWGGISS